MMLVVAVVTSATVYIAGNNFRSNQQRVLDRQFQDQVRAFEALQEARSNAITEKCRALSQSVRLRAALEEHDTEDLYQNALTELQSILGRSANNAITDRKNEIRADFFRFFDSNGALLDPGPDLVDAAGDIPFKEALAPVAVAVRNLANQGVGFIAVGTGDRPSALRHVVITKIGDWNGKALGALIIGFPIENMRGPKDATGREIESGLWMSGQLYTNHLSAPDRRVVAQQVGLATRKVLAGNFVIDLQGGPDLLFYKPLHTSSGLQTAYEICLYPIAESLHEARLLTWKIIVLGFVVLCLGFVASHFLANKLSKPVDELAATSAEHFSRRQKAEADLVETNRELEKALSDLKAAQQQVIQQERLSALGQMAAGIAHDFNNNLMPILGFADVLLENDALLGDKVEARRCLEMLRTSAKDAASVVSRLREFYRPAESDEAFPVVDLTKIIEQAVALTKPKWRGLTQARGITVTVETKVSARPFIAGDESALREVLTNLLFNAVDAMPEGGRICIEAAVEKDHAVIRVSDTGTGMTEIVRRRCLEPFFSTKGDRGTGLGLSMVYGIVERHRGQLEIESAVGEGTTFIIRLPLAEELPAQSGANVAPEQGSALNVLVVDDDARSREVLITYLRSDQHSVASASTGREALEKFKRGRFDLVLMDRAMPEMSGEQTARFIKQIKPGAPIILVSGFSGQLETSGSEVIDAVLQKPITLDVLRRTIAKLVYAA